MTLLALVVAVTAGAQVNGFEPPYNPDSNADAFIGTHDLMDLLSAFGSAFEPENIYVSTDSTHMVVLGGYSVNLAECHGICAGMGNQWRVINLADFGIYEELVNQESDNIPSAAWLNESNLLSFGVEWAANSSSPNSQIWPYWGYYNGLTFGTSETNLGCYCATQERPKVEYSYCTGSDIQSCADAKVADGWYPLGGIVTHENLNYTNNGYQTSGSTHHTQAFWRWAE